MAMEMVLTAFVSTIFVVSVLMCSGSGKGGGGAHTPAAVDDESSSYEK